MSADPYIPDVEAAYQRIRASLGRSSDVILRKIVIPACPDGPVLIACLDGMADTQMVDQDIIQRLLASHAAPARWDETTITPAHITKHTTWPPLLQGLASGNTLIFAPD